MIQNRGGVLKLSLPITLMFLCTIFDEQLVLCILYFSFISILLSVIYKQIHTNTIVFTGSLFLYFLWYAMIGKYLFTVFTPHALSQHIHKYSSFLAILFPYKLVDCIVLYCRLIINSNLIYCLPVIILSLVLLLTKKTKQFTCDLLIIPVFVLVLSFLLVCANALGHGAIIEFPDMKYSTYLAPALFLFYFGLIYFILKLFSNFQSMKMIINVFLLSLLVVVFIHRHNWQKYYNIHVQGIGHMVRIDKEDEIYNSQLSHIIKNNNISQRHYFLTWNIRWNQIIYEEEVR